VNQAETIRQLCRALELAASLARELEAALTEEQEQTGPGRRPIVPTPEQEREVLRLRHTNGRLGYRAIGARVEPPLSWRVVARILNEYEASQNPSETSQNSSALGAAKARSTSNRPRKGGAL
jgi:hypothetical protein